MRLMNGRGVLRLTRGTLLVLSALVVTFTLVVLHKMEEPSGKFAVLSGNRRRTDCLGVFPLQADEPLPMG